MWQSQLRNITQIEPFGDNINKLKTIPPPSLNYRLVTARQTEEKEEEKKKTRVRLFDSDTATAVRPPGWMVQNDGSGAHREHQPIRIEKTLKKVSFYKKFGKQMKGKMIANLCVFKLPVKQTDWLANEVFVFSHQIDFHTNSYHVIYSSLFLLVIVLASVRFRHCLRKLKKTGILSCFWQGSFLPC